MKRYVALLRGINVGGKNLIKMSDLRACLEADGFLDVATYIQSGNVLFSADGDAAILARRLEALLSKRFSYASSLVLRSSAQLRATVARAPEGFGTQPATFHYDALFLKEPLTAKVALKTVPIREGVDQAHAGPGVIYFSRLIREAARSQLSRVASMPIYRSMTIRNWNTTTKLARMIETPDE